MYDYASRLAEQLATELLINRNHKYYSCKEYCECGLDLEYENLDDKLYKLIDSFFSGDFILYTNGVIHFFEHDEELKNLIPIIIKFNLIYKERKNY